MIGARRLSSVTLVGGEACDSLGIVHERVDLGLQDIQTSVQAAVGEQLVHQLQVRRSLPWANRRSDSHARPATGYAANVNSSSNAASSSQPCAGSTLSGAGT